MLGTIARLPIFSGRSTIFSGLARQGQTLHSWSAPVQALRGQSCSSPPLLKRWRPSGPLGGLLRTCLRCSAPRHIMSFPFIPLARCNAPIRCPCTKFGVRRTVDRLAIIFILMKRPPRCPRPGLPPFIPSRRPVTTRIWSRVSHPANAAGAPNTVRPV